MVKKKAALTLLRLYRKHSDVFPAAEWALRIVSIMDDTDLVGQGFIELAPSLYLSLGRSSVCHNPSFSARTRPPGAIRCLLSKSRGPTESGKLHFLSSAALFLIAYAASC
jgi:hypothetical protein